MLSVAYPVGRVCWPILRGPGPESGNVCGTAGEFVRTGPAARSERQAETRSHGRAWLPPQRPAPASSGSRQRQRQGQAAPGFARVTGERGRPIAAQNWPGEAAATVVSSPASAQFTVRPSGAGYISDGSTVLMARQEGPYPVGECNMVPYSAA